MRYLITGITGFVGPHLAKLLLKDGHNVSGLIRTGNGRQSDLLDVMTVDEIAKIRWEVGDFTNREQISNLISWNSYDGIFHLGAQSHPPTSFSYPHATFVDNTIGTINIVDAIVGKSPNTRLVFCSTSEVYGAVEEVYGPITEGFPLAPINPYGVSKASADMYVRERAKTTGCKLCCTRAFSHTGPRRGKNFSISSDAYQIADFLVRKKKENGFLRVGTLGSKRVVADVRDIVRGYYDLMSKFESGEAYNIGGEVPYTIGELLDKMIDLYPDARDLVKWVDPKLVRPIDIPVQLCDSTKIKELTSWKTTYAIEKTLEDLVNYWIKKQERRV